MSFWTLPVCSAPRGILKKSRVTSTSALKKLKSLLEKTKRTHREQWENFTRLYPVKHWTVFNLAIVKVHLKQVPQAETKGGGKWRLVSRSSSWGRGVLKWALYDSRDSIQVSLASRPITTWPPPTSGGILIRPSLPLLLPTWFSFPVCTPPLVLSHCIHRTTGGPTKGPRHRSHRLCIPASPSTSWGNLSQIP